MPVRKVRTTLAAVYVLFLTAPVVALGQANHAAAIDPPGAAQAAPSPPAAPVKPAPGAADAGVADVRRPEPLPLPVPAPGVGSQAAPAAPAAAAPVKTSSNENKPLAPLVQPPAAGGGTKTTGADPNWILQTVMALAGVVALVFFLRAVFAKVSGRPIASGRSPLIEVLARVSVAPRNHVLLLRLGQRILVVGDSAGGLQTLADLSDPDEVAAILTTLAAGKANSVTGSFNRVMSRFDRQYEAEAELPDIGGDEAEAKTDRSRDQLSGLLSRVRTMARKDAK